MTTVAIAQLAATADREANRSAAVAAVERAAREGARLVVLPEYAAAFDPRGVTPDLAEPLDGPFVAALREVAAREGVAVVAGTTEPVEDDPRAVNTVVAVDAAGGLAGRYRKVHLYDAFGQRESDRFVAGPADAPPLVVEVDGLRCGVLTCYDLRFPESARRLVDAGAEALLVPAAWAAGPRKAEHWRALLVARAIESTAAVVGAGMAGPGVVGRSLAVAADGEVLAELGPEPGAVVVELDPARVAEVRRANPSLANRRYAVVPRA